MKRLAISIALASGCGTPPPAAESPHGDVALIRLR